MVSIARNVVLLWLNREPLVRDLSRPLRSPCQAPRRLWRALFPYQKRSPRFRKMTLPRPALRCLLIFTLSFLHPQAAATPPLNTVLFPWFHVSTTKTVEKIAAQLIISVHIASSPFIISQNALAFAVPLRPNVGTGPGWEMLEIVGSVWKSIVTESVNRPRTSAVLYLTTFCFTLITVFKL